jgi:hypothetical protein
MELFGPHRRDLKNASEDQPSPEPRSGDFALTTPVQPAIKKLPVSALLFGIIAGIIGITAGLFLGFALSAALAAAFHVSTFEGEAGYFATAIALLTTCIIAPGLILLTLYWRGTRGLWLFAGLVAVCLSLGLIAVSGFGIWYAGQPHVLNINGPTPLLEFEVKPPAGQLVESLADVQPKLDTPRNPRPMPGYWHTDAPKDAGARRLRRTLFPHFATALRVEISRRHRPNFPAQAAGQSNEGEIPRLVRLAKPGLCSERGRAAFSPLRGKRISDSLQSGLPGPINVIATLVERVVLNASARKLPPRRLQRFLCHRSEPDCYFQEKPVHLSLLRTSAWFTSSAARVSFWYVDF